MPAAANGIGWMTPYHDRMPVLLQGDDIGPWLKGQLGCDGIKRAAESALREWPVTKRMNRTGEGDDDPSIAQRVA